MRRTPWFDRCLDWIFEAYTHATSPDEVRAYLACHPDLDEVLVKMIVQIRTRVAHDIRISAKVVAGGSVGEYLEVTACQVPLLPSFGAAIQQIWDEQIAHLSGKNGWIALLSDDWTPAPIAKRVPALPQTAPLAVKTAVRQPAWAAN
jgi:hypothetical protein